MTDSNRIPEKPIADDSSDDAAAPVAGSERGETIGQGYIEERMAGTESHQRATFSDPIPPGDPERIAGEDRAIPGREE